MATACVGVTSCFTTFCTTSRRCSDQRVRVPVAKSGLTLKHPPYELDALEPYMSKKSLEFHWGKHHRAYVDNLNKQIEGTEYEKNTLEELVTNSFHRGNPGAVFNNAGQVWNHDFFWESMKPEGGKGPNGELLEKINVDFGSYDEFVRQFKEAALSQFGSGWAWLLLKDKKLAVEKTSNAFNPLIWGHIPLLVIDVWEHAYYLDFQNQRADYVSTFIDNLVNWDAVSARLERAKVFVNWGVQEVPKGF
uniref:Superoxide dismutase n=1 Tax=Isoetes sinensis TaxID=283158 RepID=A0A0C5LPU4_9TRAC|nr:Fe superoxide dismutase [Isoetes sinensis]